MIRAATAVAGGHTPEPADVATAAAARSEQNRLSLRASAALTHLAVGVSSDDPAAVLAEADAAAALVAELSLDGRELREWAAVLSAVRALAALRTDAPPTSLLAGLRSAAAAAHMADCRRLRGHLVAQLALLEALEGHLNRALHLAGEAETLAAEVTRREGGHEPAAALAMAWIQLRRYALAEAREWLTRARTLECSGAASLPTAALGAVLQSQLLRLRHEYDAAEQVLGPHLRGARLPSWIAEQVVTEVVRLAMARGHVEEGLRILRDSSEELPWSPRLQAAGSLFTGTPDGLHADETSEPASLSAAVESAVIRAAQTAESGNPTTAAELLAGALALARPELLRWPFLDAPLPVRRLLRAHPRLQAAGAWLNPRIPAPRAARDADVAEPDGAEVVQELSERELEVLRHLAEMLSTAEIAATMFISVNTVRTHIRSILRKLAVSRRNQAVRRARERGIL